MDIVSVGLAQIPTGDSNMGLRKLIEHIDAGGYVELNGTYGGTSYDDIPTY